MGIENEPKVPWAIVLRGENTPEEFPGFIDKLPDRLRRGLGKISLVTSATLRIGPHAESLDIDQLQGHEQEKAECVNKADYVEFLENRGWSKIAAGKSWNHLAHRYMINRYGGRLGLAHHTVDIERAHFFPVKFTNLDASDYKHYQDAVLDVSTLKEYTDYLDGHIRQRGTTDILPRLTGGNVGELTLRGWEAVVDNWLPEPSDT